MIDCRLTIFKYGMVLHLFAPLQALPQGPIIKFSTLKFIFNLGLPHKSLAHLSFAKFTEFEVAMGFCFLIAAY